MPVSIRCIQQGCLNARNGGPPCPEFVCKNTTLSCRNNAGDHSDSNDHALQKEVAEDAAKIINEFRPHVQAFRESFRGLLEKARRLEGWSDGKIVGQVKITLPQCSPSFVDGFNAYIKYFSMPGTCLTTSDGTLIWSIGMDEAFRYLIEYGE